MGLVNPAMRQENSTLDLKVGDRRDSGGEYEISFASFVLEKQL